ncbi:DNA (cytosine-5)-methyltransferase 1 [Candidatus Planktophila versatilis]|uniref:Cytosine-specific methyltransferase n=1 Tax=Candidatus Planktophila versatilis TaxID=1884905 RepID=A0AAD0E6I4_9ACTN|nr:DNA (cytosine-5-)-methyltransferase [Candidatus Planktophila versatilis]ASY22392.1 DNA (cytosine-5)-methyltransferase 1 [Candidatus Planktophila versatilis]
MAYKSKGYKEPTNPVGNVAELFAGVGGFRIGLARAGWKTTFSNQWEPATKVQHASDVYVAQFGEDGHANTDIAKVKSLPKNIDLLVGGFPCQDYSVAKTLNSSKGLKGKKGVLWWEILRLVNGQKPKFIFLENVDRLLKSPSNQRGRDFAVMLKTLGDEGYTIEWRVVNAAEYGFPQRRIRVFIVATRNKSTKNLNPHDLIAKKGILARALPIEKFMEDLVEIDLVQDADEISSRFNKGKEKSPFLNAGVLIDGIAYTVKTQAKLSGSVEVLGDVLQSDSEVPGEYWVEEKRLKEWKYLKGAKSIERTHKASGVTYNYAEGKMAFPDLLTNPSRTILTGEGGTTPSRFKHIIKTKNGYRRLTPIELERLNGFPDNWSLKASDGKTVSDAKRAFFMGNALVIGLIEKVGKVIAADISTK